jgi:hypothetical protein
MAGRPSQQRSAGDALRLAWRRYFRRLARALGAFRDGNGRFQLDEPLGDELRFAYPGSRRRQMFVF